MTAIYLYDDAVARRFEPFALTRPMGEVRIGARLIRERWTRAVGMPAAGFISSVHLADFEEPGASSAARGTIPAGALLVNARCAPQLAPARADLSRADVLECDGRLAAVRVAAPLPVADLDGGTAVMERLAGTRRRTPIAGWWIDEVWGVLADLEQRLATDLTHLVAGLAPEQPAGCAVLGTHGVYAAADAVIEPFITFDCTNGPIVVESGATVLSFTRIQGPTWIGPRSTVGGDRVTVCAIGEDSKVHGEASSVVIIGHSNKAHDGFVGQSYLSRWVNLGANTVTSNLKNTYGAVSLWTPDGVRNTGQQFLGALVGDHAKTGIGMTLTTGSVIGAGAQVFGAETQPKVVPPFAWGNAPPYGTFEIEKFLVVAERVMARRHVTLGERGRAHLRRAFAARWSADS